MVKRDEGQRRWRRDGDFHRSQAGDSQATARLHARTLSVGRKFPSTRCLFRIARNEVAECGTSYLERRQLQLLDARAKCCVFTQNAPCGRVRRDYRAWCRLPRLPCPNARPLAGRATPGT